MKHIAFLLIACVSPLPAQWLSAGVKGGGFFTDPAGRLDNSRKYVVGPMAEIGLHPRVGIELNALYSRFGTLAVTADGRTAAGNSWEFPILGKYYFTDKSGPVSPYLSSGFAIRHIWMENEGRRPGTTIRIPTTDPAAGAVVGGGVRVKMGMLTLSPEVRYTRWGGYNFPATNPNQIQALVGIGF